LAGGAGLLAGGAGLLAGGAGLLAFGAGWGAAALLTFGAGWGAAALLAFGAAWGGAIAPRPAMDTLCAFAPRPVVAPRAHPAFVGILPGLISVSAFAPVSLDALSAGDPVLVVVVVSPAGLWHLVPGMSWGGMCTGVSAPGAPGAPPWLLELTDTLLDDRAFAGLFPDVQCVPPL